MPLVEEFVLVNLVINVDNITQLDNGMILYIFCKYIILYSDIILQNAEGKDLITEHC